MIREENFYFRSNEEHVKIHGIRWIPEGEIHAILQVAHGMAEHMERYREFGMYLAERGILVTGIDDLGHGKSITTEEDYGYFAKKDGNTCVMKDLLSLTKLTKKKYPGFPYFMLGHSMGSFLTRQYLCFYGKELDGAIICGTASQPGVILVLGKMICRIQALFCGWRYRSNLLNNMSFGSYNKHFRPNRTEYDWLSRNEESVDRYVEDPACGFVFTLNGFYNMFTGLQKIINKSFLERMPKKLPVFFIAGEKDPVGSFGSGVRKVVKQFEKLEMQDVTCKIYPENRHELLNDLDRGQVFNDILMWIREKISAS